MQNYFAQDISIRDFSIGANWILKGNTWGNLIAFVICSYFNSSCRFTDSYIEENETIASEENFKKYVNTLVNEQLPMNDQVGFEILVGRHAYLQNDRPVYPVSIFEIFKFLLI